MTGPQPSALIRFVRRIAVSESTETADAPLVRRFAQCGDAEAFATLVQRHGPMVFGVCQRMLGDHHEAEDCFQATFLILARRARAVGRPELVGGWLHGVACRVAARARQVRARRRARERQVVDVPATDSTPELIWTDLRPVLDEEVARLPDRIRLPFVLCYLDGRTNEQAAELLGCPKGTVLSRLATARERLRRRLTRRGITLPAALFGTWLVERATAAVPAPLLESTINGIAGTVPANVAVLVEGVLLTMRIHRFAKLFGLMLLTALFAGGTGTLLRSPLLAQADGEKPQAPAANAETGKKQESPAAKPDDAPAPVQPQSIIEAFEVNDARADEMFTGKRVRVIGTMSRVKRVSAEGANRPNAYRLTLDSVAIGGGPGGAGSGMGPGGPWAGPGGFKRGGGGRPAGPLGGAGMSGGPGPGGPPGGGMPAVWPDMPLTFDFPLSAAKELAVLRPGQIVTVEGVCRGPGEDQNGFHAIRFVDAKLIEVHKHAEPKLTETQKN
jgi:RNA polymerase sigma factor (sigma-70 family)